MTEPDGMDELRARLRRAEDDARAARYLAGGADRDVGEIRTELRALRSEMRSEFVDVRAEMRSEFVDVRAEMRSEFVDVRAEMRSEFVDVRAEMRSFRDQNNRVLSAMRADLTDLRTDMDEGFRTMHEGFRVIDDRFLEIRGVLDGQAGWNQRLADMLEVLIRRQGDDSTDRT
ncbi:MAG: hypothetical protein JNM77_00930 [Pseudonocardia sp.]|nr:hypothetical protein [Pseudonocardia sp.]